MVDVVVSDVAALKIADAILAAQVKNSAALVAHAASIEAVFNSLNPLGGGKAGSMALLTSNIDAQLGSLTTAVRDNTDAINKLTMATGKISSSIEVLTKAAGTIQYTMTKQLTTQQLVAADQIKNNKFNQLTTNEAKERAGLPPTEVKTELTTATIKENVSTVGIINAQTTATTIITDQLTESTKEGFAIATGWIAQTAFAKWITSYWTESKLQIELLFADEKAKKEIGEKIDAVRRARNNPASAK